MPFKQDHDYRLKTVDLGVWPWLRPLQASFRRATIGHPRCQRPTKRAAPLPMQPFEEVAEWTGLEPATPGVTGRYSDQLNYHSAWC